MKKHVSRNRTVESHDPTVCGANAEPDRRTHIDANNKDPDGNWRTRIEIQPTQSATRPRITMYDRSRVARLSRSPHGKPRPRPPSGAPGRRRLSFSFLRRAFSRSWRSACSASAWRRRASASSARASRTRASSPIYESVCCCASSCCCSHSRRCAPGRRPASPH